MTRQLNYSKIIVATLLVGLVFYLVSNVNHFISIPYIGYFSLLIFGTIAYCLVFGFKAYEKLYQKPVQFWKNFIKYFLIAQLFSFVLGILIVAITHTHKGNPAADNPIWFFFLIMPFALIGEELFSIYFYDLFKLKASPLVANILVSIIFGLIHYWTYFNGAILLTILQVIALQGSARFWFNRSYEQSNSILTSFAVHYLFDLAGFMLSFLLH